MFRRSKFSTIDLFSFQDIIMCVIGIVFLIVLLLSLELINTSAILVRDTGITSSFHSNLSEEYRKLQNKYTSLLKQNKFLSELSLYASKPIESKLLQLKSLNVRYRQICIELNEKNKKLKKLTKNILVLKTKVQKMLKILEEQKRKLNSLKESVRGSYVLMPKIAFILSNDPKIPWIVDVGKSCISVIDKKQTMVIKFSTHSTDNDFLKWAKSVPTDRYYFVVIFRPSSYREAEEIWHKLSVMGFDEGMELIPDSWTIHD